MSKIGDEVFAKSLQKTYRDYGRPLSEIKVDETLHPDYLTDKEIELYKQIRVLAIRTYWVLFSISQRRRDIERGRKYTLKTGKVWRDRLDPLYAPTTGYIGNYK